MKPWEECYKCEKADRCPYKNIMQRLPRENGGLGLCPKIKKEDSEDV